MLYSGASLVRAAGHQAERVERLKVSESVKPVSNPGQSGSSLDEDTQGALLRFARFVTKEAKKPPEKPRKKVAAGLPVAYVSQLKLNDPGRGATLDIYI